MAGQAVLDSNFNPRNTLSIPPVEIIAFPRSESGIFDLSLTKLKSFYDGSIDLIYNFFECEYSGGPACVSRKRGPIRIEAVSKPSMP